MKYLLILNIIWLGLMLMFGEAHAEISYSDFGKLADAIYLAEGGAKTAHPYGILAKYKHTSPRQACLNTIKHKHIDWVNSGSKGDFIAYLGSKYAPINSDTDNGTNRYWVKNVRFHLKKSILRP